MSRDSASLLDIVRAGQLVLQFAQGLNREQLASDLLKQSAILQDLRNRPPSPPNLGGTGFTPPKVGGSGGQNDGICVSPILYQIAIIGEATKRLSREFRSQHPEVPWDDIAGMRDFIVHQYDQLDLDIAWQVTQRNIPELYQFPKCLLQIILLFPPL